MGKSWERASFGSGGRLELPKCFCVLVCWTWEQGKLRRTTTEETPGDATLKSILDGTDVVVPRREVNLPHGTAGAHVAGNGTNESLEEKTEDEVKIHKGQTDAFLGKVNDIGERMNKLNIKEHEAAMALDLCFLPALRHVMPASTLDAEEN